MGKFGVGLGGLVGRETPPKGVSLRLQGLPFPYPPIAFLISACVSEIEPEALTITMRS